MPRRRVEGQRSLGQAPRVGETPGARVQQGQVEVGARVRRVEAAGRLQRRDRLRAGRAARARGPGARARRPLRGRGASAYSRKRRAVVRILHRDREHARAPSRWSRRCPRSSGVPATTARAASAPAQREQRTRQLQAGHVGEHARRARPLEVADGVRRPAAGAAAPGRARGAPRPAPATTASAASKCATASSGRPASSHARPTRYCSSPGSRWIGTVRASERAGFVAAGPRRSGAPARSVALVGEPFVEPPRPEGEHAPASAAAPRRASPAVLRLASARREPSRGARPT